ncbi:MAG: hypothetical protein ACLRZZ_08165 [Enterocloster sp.]
MALASRDAQKRLGSQLVLATDPDCDRVGIRGGQNIGKEITGFASGNETGVRRCRLCGPGGAGVRRPCQPDRFPVKTIVTSDLAG